MNVPFIENISPHFKDVFLDFQRQQHSHYWLAGGRGSTKSAFASICLIYHLLTNPRSHALCARMYKSDLHKSVYSQLVRTINMLGLSKYFKFSDNPARAFPIKFLPTSQLIYFEGLDTAESIKSITPTFGQISFSWFEEVHQLQGMQKIRTALQSLRRGGRDKFITFYTYNPPRNKTNWVNEESEYIRQESINNPNSDYYHSNSCYLDLPKYCLTNWLGDDFVKDALFLKTKDEEAYKHEYLGIPTGYGTTVFKNLNIREITGDEIATFDNIAGGLDFGFAQDPLAYTRSHYDVRYKKLYILDEIGGIGLLNSDFVKLYKRKDSIPERELIICDSAEPKSISELVREYSLNCIGMFKAKGSVESTTKYLQDLTEIVIDKERTPQTYHNFMNAEFETDRNGNVLQRLRHPNDFVDSCVVKGTLIDTLRGKVPIEEIEVGDMVRSYCFNKRQFVYKKCLSAGITGKDKNVYKLILNNNFKLMCTDNHPIATIKGFKKLKRLDVLDSVIVDSVHQFSSVVKTIKPIFVKQDVYNLEIEDTHNYVANGIVVHNCRYRISIEMVSKGGWNTKVTPKHTPHTLQRKRTYL